GDLAQLLGPLLPRHLRPRSVVEGVARGLDGALRVFPARLGDVGDLLARRRGVGRERLARLRGGPLAVDDELGVGHGWLLSSCATVRRRLRPVSAPRPGRTRPTHDTRARARTYVQT